MLLLEMPSNIKYHLLLDIQDGSLKVCSCPLYKTIRKLFSLFSLFSVLSTYIQND